MGPPTGISPKLVIADETGVPYTALQKVHTSSGEVTMPKASSSSNRKGSGGGSAKSRRHLPRNQACHQCRRKKLKCDAGRPCGPCMRAHAHVIAPLVVRGEPFDPHPNCTYDDANEDSSQPVASTNTVDSGPIFNRQAEEVRQHESFVGPAVGENQSRDALDLPLGRDDSNVVFLLESRNSGPLATDPGSGLYPQSRIGRPYSYDSATLPRPDPPEVLVPGGHRPTSHPLFATTSPNLPSDRSSPLPLSDSFFHLTSTPNGPNSFPSIAGLISTGYPSTLPPPTLLRHLVDVFFSCVPHASHLIHRPSFLASLLEPPSSTNYPSTSLLHAICALASLHTTVPGIKAISEHWIRGIINIFIRAEQLEMEQGLASHKSGAFAVEHAALARAMIEFDVRVGGKERDTARASVVLFWYYHANAQWIDAWFISAMSLKICVPLGLNCSSIYNSEGVLSALEVVTTLPAAQSILEQEKRRNIWWLSFLTDRLELVHTQWPGCIAEDEIGQELPGKLSDFEAGRVMPGPRQRISDPDLLTNHPLHLTDGFTLYLKAFILISRVASFNCKLKVQRQSDINNGVLPPEAGFRGFPMFSETVLFPGNDSTDPNPTSYVRIPDLPEFHALETALTAFGVSIPKEYRDPFARRDGFERMDFRATRPSHESSVDPILYALHIIPAMGVLLLHAPHANVYSSTDQSKVKVVQATRVVVDSIYSLMATSYDVTLLPKQCTGYWSATGRFLCRMYLACLRQNRFDDAAGIRSEIDAISLMIGRVGERLPIGLRAHKEIIELVAAIDQDVSRVST